MGSISFYTPTHTGDELFAFYIIEGSKHAMIYVPKERAIERMEEAIKLMKETK